MVPQLRELQRRYPRELVVVGVHAPKFPGERETASVAHAMARHGLDHPVVNDRDLAIWNAYAVRAWPTLVFIDPRGRVIGRHEGEAPLAALVEVVEAMLGEFRADGSLQPGEPVTAAAPAPQGPLAYPGKVLAADGRWFVADSGHGRVVALPAGGGAVRAAYGAGRLAAPQGLALLGGTLYVADPEAHRIWAVELATGDLRAAAGTGEQGWPEGEADGPRTALNSPWDLAPLPDGSLAVAMAGQHRLWRFWPASGRLAPLAGSGREALRDGPAATACFAQPSGLALGADGVLYVADSEASAIRAVDPATGQVRTVVGQGLFEFGDRDGHGPAVRLQHPLGVAWGDGALWIADAYNGKVKRCDPARAEVRTLAAGLHEPGGLCWLGDGRLLVADTNAHRLVVVATADGGLAEVAVTDESAVRSGPTVAPS
jgi:sugar lactone lactonase YvrE